jgi:hypothetical protein
MRQSVTVLRNTAWPWSTIGAFSMSVYAQFGLQRLIERLRAVL